MCEIDQLKGILSFEAIGRILRELFAKNHGRVRSTTQCTSARVNFARYLNYPSHVAEGIYFHEYHHCNES